MMHGCKHMQNLERQYNDEMRAFMRSNGMDEDRQETLSILFMAKLLHFDSCGECNQRASGANP